MMDNSRVDKTTVTDVCEMIGTTKLRIGFRTR